MHSLHGDIHEIGLQDDCPACKVHAENPLRDLDDTMLLILISRNRGYRFEKQSACEPRSHNEAVAMKNITNVMENMGKLFEVDSLTMIRYLQKNWRNGKVAFVG